MFHRTRLWHLLLLPVLCTTGCASKYTDFGEPLSLKAKDTVSLGDVLKDMDHYDGKTVCVSGTVAAVCEAKGCWLEMTAKHQPQRVFVKFTCPVEGRLIPMEAIGHPVVVEGTIKTHEVSQAEARHMAEDGGATAQDIARIVGPQKRLQIFSPAARIYGI